MAGETLEELRALLPAARPRRLANGLEICLLENRQAPVVSTVLAYRAGCRDDPPSHGGTAHFLEHMMFKGSAPYAVGEIDRLTRRLGGSNNAFTSHDATVYTFAFSSDHWRTALAIEAARMTGLELDPREVESERRVILEEIAMYESEPWDALEHEVLAARFPDHPYGRPVLGSRAELIAADGTTLREFHRCLYRPENAVLVLAGALGDGAFEEAEAIFGAVDGGSSRRASMPSDPGLDRLERRVRRQGETARLLLALPAAPADTVQGAHLRLLLAVLGSGRASRLHRALVDRGQLCVWVSSELQDAVGAGTVMIAAEVVPGVEPERVETAILAELERLIEEPPDDEELERARRMLLADWTFGHERIHQQAMVVALALALFDLEQPYREWQRIFTARRDDLAATAERFLRPERGAVVGWSLPS